MLAPSPGAENDFEGLKIMVSAGATQEPIDDVRYISNRSSGLMGFALAEEAAERGAKVVLIKGSTSVQLSESFNGKVVEALTAKEMADEIKKRAKETDIFLHAAAVADFIPNRTEGKIDSGRTSMLELLPGQKIIDQVKAENPKIFLVGFKAECTDSVNELVEKAGKKLLEAKADLICANNVSRKDIGFGAAANEVVMVDKNNQIKILEKKSKKEIARKILDEVYGLQ
jgi:phosphopantothenoylcysteine decarboxylase/phosphopantothenate--cysteine ligase